MKHSKFWELVPKIGSIFAVMAVLFFAVSLFPPFRSLLEGSVNYQITSSLIFSLLTGVVLRSISDLKNDSKGLSKRLEAFSYKISGDSHLINNGVQGVYAELKEILKKRGKDTNELVIEILAFTTFSIPDNLNNFHSRGLLNNCTIKIFHLSKSHLESDIYPSSWKSQLVENLNKINLFQERSPDVRIELIPYQHLPAIHGFKVGSAVLFISFADFSDGQLKAPNTIPFLRIDGSDRSKRAIYLRVLFNNWIRQASFSK